ncbi:MAG: cold shock and DUF1294 domain-containing protein [Cyanobacteria bacterium P01_D01_bin.44]
MHPSWHKGQLKNWKDKQGFGFIRPNQGGRDIFLHISALQPSTRRPQVGDTLHYQIKKGTDGKVQAGNAFIQGATVRGVPQETQAQARTAKAPYWQVILLGALPVVCSVQMALGASNVIPLVAYTVMSAITIRVYASDKQRAQQNRWRIPENQLHLCELLGGWLGAFWAQQTLRHKNKKTSYQVVFWIIVMTHLAFWVVWLVAMNG